MIEKQFKVKRKDVGMLRHVIAHAIGDSFAGVEQYDAYIYECFRAFAHSKLDVVLDYADLKDAPSHLCELVVPCLVHSDEYSAKGELSANIPTPTLLRLFPNLRTLNIHCGGKNKYHNSNHPVSVSTLCATFSEQALRQHEHIRRIRVEQLYVSEEAVAKLQSQSAYKHKFQMSFEEGYKCYTMDISKTM